MKRVPYTQKTLELLRKRGYLAQVVEKWQPHSMRRIDLFGIIDIVAVGEGTILGVQSTSWNGKQKHEETLLEHKEELAAWTSSGGVFAMILWKKQKIKRGGIAFRYVPEWIEYDLVESKLNRRFSLKPEGDPISQEDLQVR